MGPETRVHTAPEPVVAVVVIVISATRVVTPASPSRRPVPIPPGVEVAVDGFAVAAGRPRALRVTAAVPLAVAGGPEAVLAPAPGPHAVALDAPVAVAVVRPSRSSPLAVLPDAGPISRASVCLISWLAKGGTLFSPGP